MCRGGPREAMLVAVWMSAIIAVDADGMHGAQPGLRNADTIFGQPIDPELNLALAAAVRRQRGNGVPLLQKSQNGFEPSTQRDEAISWTIDEALRLVGFLAKAWVEGGQAIETAG